MAISYAPLRHLMEKHEISYRKLRAELDIHSTYTTRMKNDAGYVSLETIDLLCEYFDVSVNEIIEYYDQYEYEED
ncbi:hypothetical protein 8F11_12 [uncultured Caudovirales phage]|uniref:HTH cro/C1-type domain-containing protein n=1 Tax=uncultured Caudovirales phage TaxID=2100421 RepID=A0A2H4J449_9CAUD|nr:hypothetical protein 8F11_12 [uncultured Caudovirales phage]